MKENSEPSNSGKEGYDPFAPENVRLDQSELDRPAVKPELTSLPVRKPEKFEFIRVCSDPDFRFGPISFIEIKRSREYCLSAATIQIQPGSAGILDRIRFSGDEHLGEALSLDRENAKPNGPYKRLVHLGTGMC